MKKMVKISGAVAVAVLAAAAMLYSVLRPLPVETVVVQPLTISLTFTEAGSYEYSRLYSVYSLVSGEILELSAQQGQPIKAGDPIAIVSASDYEYQIQQLNSAITGYQGQISNLWLQEQQEKASLSASLQSLEGQLLTLEAEAAKNQSASSSLETQVSIQERIVSVNFSNVSQARKYLREMRDYGDDYEVIQARQALNTAQSTLAQNQLLLEQLREGHIPEEIYEGQRRALQGQIDAISSQIAQSYSGGMYQYYNAQIEAAQSSITQMEEKSGQATIAAPVDGILCFFPAENQNILSQQTLVAHIGSAPYVEVFVPMREIDGVALGDSVELIFDKRLGNETTTGTVFDIEEEAQVKLSALGVEERKVRVLIKPAQGGLQIGGDMDVRFSPYTFEEVLSVPKTAVFQLDGQDVVWLIRDDRLVKQVVERGVETREGYIISHGLEPGDIVATDANQRGLLPGKRATSLAT